MMAEQQKWSNSIFRNHIEYIGYLFSYDKLYRYVRVYITQTININFQGWQRTIMILHISYG